LEAPVFDLPGGVRIAPVAQADAASLSSLIRRNADHLHKSAAVAYFIGKDFQGRGIVTSSVSSVIGYGFGRLGLNRIELQCAAGNLASRRVAERLGFTLEGTLRQSEILHGAVVDVHVFGMLREEFKFQER